ncbi:hypothetical protein EDC04DRAFT_2602453 [Pisolithus marmoratus]|nr:hypothetical protein EDC04DRAFT_2602453 [Pisolithus marmoratus]
MGPILLLHLLIVLGMMRCNMEITLQDNKCSPPQLPHIYIQFLGSQRAFQVVLVLSHITNTGTEAINLMWMHKQATNVLSTTLKYLHHGQSLVHQFPACIDLFDEQAAMLAKAIDKHKQQLHQWFHWHAGSGKNHMINHKTYQLVDKLLKPKAHINKDWEIYAKVYYHSQVKPKMEGSMMDILTLCQKIKDAFESKSEEIQDEIFHLKEEQVAVASASRDGGKDSMINNEDDSIINLKVCQLNIKQCGPALQHILEYMVTKTGWAFSVIMGGPDPLDVQGECIVTSLHVGENKLRYNFVQAYSRFDGEVMQAYMEFLDDTFRHVGCPAHGDEMTDNPDAGKSESNSGKGDGYSEGDEDDEDHPLNAILCTYTPPTEAIAMFSTDIVTNLASVATPLVNMISPDVATCPDASDSVPMPIATPPNVTLITTYDPISACIATPTIAGQVHGPTLAYATVPISASIAKQSGDNVQAYTPTLNPVDLSLASGVPNLTAGLPMAYGDASHPISHTSNFDFSAMMAFDFPALLVCETDIGAMTYGNTSFTTSSAPVQLSFGSIYSMPQVPMPVSSPIATRADAFQHLTLDLPNNFSTATTISLGATDVNCISSRVASGKENAVVGLPPISPAASPPSVLNLPVIPLPSIQLNSAGQDITVAEPIPGNPSSDAAQVATPLAAIETAMCCPK